MKKVLLTAFVASFAAITASAQFGPPTPINGSTSDAVSVSGTVVVTDMIDLEPEQTTLPQLNINDWSQWINNTASTFGPTNNANAPVSGSTFRVWATRAFTISVNSTGLTKTAGSPAGASNTISAARLGIVTDHNWYNMVATPNFLPVGTTTWTDYAANTDNSSAHPTTGGLYGGPKQIVATESGCYNARFFSNFTFFPALADNIGGTYQGEISINAELLP